jgi:hypothetical protein
MNMTVETTEEQVSEKEYVLKVIDRCDSCNSQAYVLVKGVTGDLMFCGHHYNKNEAALIKFSYEIIDEREKLIENKLIGDAHA